LDAARRRFEHSDALVDLVALDLKDTAAALALDARSAALAGADPLAQLTAPGLKPRNLGAQVADSLLDIGCVVRVCSDHECSDHECSGRVWLLRQYTIPRDGLQGIHSIYTCAICERIKDWPVRQSIRS
jgi:hypothetical protein